MVPVQKQEVSFPVGYRTADRSITALCTAFFRPLVDLLIIQSNSDSAGPFDRQLSRYLGADVVKED